MHEITINIDDAKKAYREAKNNKDIQNLLINLFGKKIIDITIDITKRIKTFEDAYNELGCRHPYCVEWDSIYQCGNKNDDCEDIKDVIAYHKLRIIAAALNEGWKPTFMEDEGRYYPWFSLYTKEEYDELCEEDKSHIFYVDNNPFNDMIKYSGPVYVFVDSTISLSNSSYGSRIVFKTSELAKYSGRQFIDIYADFMNS